MVEPTKSNSKTKKQKEKKKRKKIAPLIIAEDIAKIYFAKETYNITHNVQQLTVVYPPKCN